MYSHKFEYDPKYKAVTLRRGPSDGWVMQVNSPVFAVTVQRRPTGELPVTPPRESPSSNHSADRCNLNYIYAYDDYNGQVFTYRDWNGEPAQGDYDYGSVGTSDVLANIDGLKKRLQSFLDVAVLEYRGDFSSLLLTWRWRINGKAYAVSSGINLLFFKTSVVDLDFFADLHHRIFLTAVSHTFNHSADTDETKSA